METTIYYFSATGNSLSLTRILAEKLGKCEIVPIAHAVRKQQIPTKSHRIGIVFPVFAWGMPQIVSDFVNKLMVGKHQYIFAVATCVAIPGNTLSDLKKIFLKKGADLNAGFSVKSERSSLMKLNTLDDIIIKLDKQRLKITSFEDRMPEIISTITNSKNHKIETSSWSANIIGSIFHGLALRSFKTIDNAFLVEESCNGCGTCAKLCPRCNIVIVNGRPNFKHNCELCHTCIQWCPNFAIKHPNFDKSLNQYRNPAVRINDMIASNY